MPKSSTKETLVLLDAHAILHRAYHALPDFASPTGEPTGALYGVTTMLLKIIEEFKPTYMVACYDLAEPTYRHDAYDGYKAGRVKTDEALVAQINRSRDIFAAFGIPLFEKAGFEADDMLGTIAHLTKTEKNLTVIIASGDMDTLQCVDGDRVQVYTLKKGIKDTILYNETAVVERFGFSPKLVPDYKGLRGDPSDNIPGIVGIGEKTATTLVTTFGSIDAIYKKLKKSEQPFLEAGLTPRIIGLLREGEEDAQFSKMLATIRTDAFASFDYTTTHWRDQADVEAIFSLFSELGFRTVTERVRKLFAVSEAAVAASVTGVTARAHQEAAILLWLLESERTNASIEDILDYGRSFLKTDDWASTVAVLEERVKAADLWELYEAVEKPLIAIIEKMQTTGITIDLAVLQALSQRLHKELQTLEETIYTAVGHEFNLNSPKQLGVVLFDELGLKPKNAKKTAGGQRSTKESELEKLRSEHPAIPAILRYRELQKLVSTYIDTLPTMVGADGRLHTRFLQTGTTTGRMGSKDPNVQNIPTRTEEGRAIRQAFVAAPGKTLVTMDYSQIELRIAAILSEDAGMIDIFKRGEDVHAGVAARVFGVPAAEVTSAMRRDAKVINFGILYGMGVNALRQNLGPDTTRQEAQEFLQAYFNTFTRLAEYLEDTKTMARNEGYTKTLFGRRRYFPGISSNIPFIRAAAERMAINAPIQGTAADIVRIAMVRIDDYLQKQNLTADVAMLLQIHDELIFEITTERVETIAPALQAIMESVLDTKETFGVPLLVSVASGPNWLEVTPLKT